MTRTLAGYSLACGPIDYQQIHGLVLDALREVPDDQWLGLLRAVGRLALRRQLAPVPSGYPPDLLERDSLPVLSNADRLLVRQVFWELVGQGIIVPGNESDPHKVFYNVSDYGRDVLREGSATPHDPMGYVARLRSETPAIDDTVVFYVNESVQCFLRGTYTASAVMIGVASERLMLLLRDAISHAMTDQQRRAKFDEATGAVGRRRAHISTVQERMMDYISSGADKLPPNVGDSLDLALRSIFDAIRITRNESGHPTGNRIPRDVAQANLQVFPFYCGRAYRLIDWCGANSW